MTEEKKGMQGFPAENSNREYKSDVFSMLMENKEYALDVYNALNGTDYKDQKSKVLQGYAYFVEKVRENTCSEGLAQAIDHAMEICIEEDVLAGFFKKRGNEVKRMMQLDFTWEAQIPMIRQEEREIGKEIGKEIGEANNLVRSVESVMVNFGVNLERACAGAGYTIKEYEDAKRLLQSEN